MKGERQAIQLEASGLDVRCGRHLVAIGEKKGIQTLILRRDGPGREQQENQRDNDVVPPESRDLHSTDLGARTHARKNSVTRC